MYDGLEQPSQGHHNHGFTSLARFAMTDEASAALFQGCHQPGRGTTRAVLRDQHHTGVTGMPEHAPNTFSPRQVNLTGRQACCGYRERGQT